LTKRSHKIWGIIPKKRDLLGEGDCLLHRVEGIIIRSMDYGESNKIITLFTREVGKVGVMVRGAKKMNSRHSSAAQLFTYGEFVFFKSGAQLGTLNHADIITSHHRLRQDLVLTAFSSYLAEMVDRILTDNEPSAFIFEQLRAALDGIEQGKDTQIITHLFEMKMLIHAGYGPNLDECAACGIDTNNPRISIRLGGLLCSKCTSRDLQVIELSEGLLKLLRLFMRVDLNLLGKVEVKPETKVILKQLMRAFLEAHIGIEWRSRHVMDQIEKYGI
jgi:DNA repair protein RecO (recombination protein O)